MADQPGVEEFNFLINKDCGCATGSTCFTACMGDPACTDKTKQPGSACNTCLNGITNTDACVKTFQTDCKADAACLKFAKELSTCPTN
jgi:hypothetical protein